MPVCLLGPPVTFVLGLVRGRPYSRTSATVLLPSLLPGLHWHQPPGPCTSPSCGTHLASGVRRSRLQAHGVSARAASGAVSASPRFPPAVTAPLPTATWATPWLLAHGHCHCHQCAIYTGPLCPSARTRPCPRRWVMACSLNCTSIRQCVLVNMLHCITPGATFTHFIFPRSLSWPFQVSLESKP